MDIAVRSVFGRFFHLAQRVARDAPRDVLGTRAAHHERVVGTRARTRINLRGTAEHRIVDEFNDVLHRFVFVVMAVDIDDQHVFEAALVTLTSRVDQKF